MNILFVCKFNRFRSKVAEGFFNKLNKNSSNCAKSAGLIRGSPISSEVQMLAKEFKISLTGEPEGLSTDLLKWQDVIVLAANDVPEEIFKDNRKYNKKLIVWKIPDTESDNVVEIRKIMSLIGEKVRGLIESLG